MSRSHILAAGVCVFLAIAAPLAVAAPGGSKSSDAIWIAGTSGAAAPASVTLSAGSSFSAGYSSKTSYPWAHAQCYNAGGSAFWGEWRALQADGTIGVFELTTVNSGVAWPSGVVNCSLDLVNTKNNSVLASTTFSVTT
jgi:hypothetical protein